MPSKKGSFREAARPFSFLTMKFSSKEGGEDGTPCVCVCFRFLADHETQSSPKDQVLARSLAGSDARACASERALGGCV